MKEQDYMNIMGAIRGEYLEEAVSWDGSERRRIRQIRRMTVSFGAVAAALAVVVGMIAYKANRDKIDTANSDTESSLVEDPETTENLYGGHGALRQMTGNYGTACYDDENVYSGDAKWSVKSGGKVTYMSEDEIPDGLFMDGKHLLRLHDGRIFETDSFGKETELVDIEAFQFPMQIEPERIVKLRKLGERLLCMDYDENAQYPTLLIADLSNKVVYQQDDPTCCTLFPDGDTSYYAFNSVTGTLVHYALKNGSLTGEQLWDADEAYFACNAAAVQDGCLYLTAKKNDGNYENPDDAPERYLVVDLSSGQLRTDAVLAPDARSYIGTAFYTAEIKNGVFCVYRNAFTDTDPEGGKPVFSVPVDQYFDTERYGMPQMPDFLSIYESEEMMIVYLPMTSDGVPRPSKHGEEGAMIDLKTGKVLYFGENYNYSTPDDSSSPAETVSATSVRGGTGTDVTGTTVNGTGTETTAYPAQTTASAAAFTVEAGHNVFGGTGFLHVIDGTYWMDDNEFYETAQSGTRFTLDQNNILRSAGSICRKNGCRHDNESCPIFHYNFEGIRSNPNSDAYDGQNVSLVPGTLSLNELFVQRGTKLFLVDGNTGAETLWIDVKPFGGLNFGDKDLKINRVTSVRGAKYIDIGKYLLSCSVSLDVPGVDPDATYLLLADRRSGTQKLVSMPGPEGFDRDMLMWGDWCQDLAENGDIYVLQNNSTLVRFDTDLNRLGSYPIPAAADALPCSRAWCVVRNVMWYLNAKDQWCSFDLNSRAVTVVKEQTGISFHELGTPECFFHSETGLFFAKKGAELMMFRYDMANSEMTGIPCWGLLFRQNVNLFNGTFFGVDADGPSGQTVFFNFQTPEWTPTMF